MNHYENLRIVNGKAVAIGEKLDSDYWNHYWENITKNYTDKFSSTDYIILSYISDHLGIDKIHLKEDRKKVKILDVGCGPGKYSEFIHKQGYDVFGLDYSSSAISLYNEKGMNGQVGDIEKLPYENEFFDVCMSIGNIAYFADPAVQLSEAIRVLKPFGHLIITFTYESIMIAYLKGRLPSPQTGENVCLYFHPSQEVIALVGNQLLTYIPLVAMDSCSERGYSTMNMGETKEDMESGKYQLIDRASLFLAFIKGYQKKE